MNQDDYQRRGQGRGRGSEYGRSSEYDRGDERQGYGFNRAQNTGRNLGPTYDRDSDSYGGYGGREGQARYAGSPDWRSGHEDYEGGSQRWEREGRAIGQARGETEYGGAGYGRGYEAAGAGRDWPDQSRSPGYGAPGRSGRGGTGSFGDDFRVGGRGIGSDYGGEYGGGYGGRSYEDRQSQQFGQGNRGQPDMGQGQDWRLGQRSQRIDPKGYTRSDDRVREDVCETLSRSGLDVREVSVQVKDGHVTLEGTVNDRRVKHDIENCVDDCGGVKDIDNRIRVSRNEAGTSGGQAGQTTQGGASLQSQQTK